jgi:hypothetical protein
MKLTLKLVACLSLTSITLLNTGCATLLGSRTADVVLYDAPEDLKVTDNGTPIETERVFSSAKSKTNYENTVTKTTTYYSMGVKLKKKVKHTLELKSAGKSTTLEIKPKMAGGWFVLDLFTTGPIGLIVDGGTKNWKILKPAHIDVPAVLNGTKQRSSKRLKKDLRKSFKTKK